MSYQTPVASDDGEATTMAGAASSLAGEPADDTITIERADFRELVIALRTLREQRKADQLAP